MIKSVTIDRKDGTKQTITDAQRVTIEFTDKPPIIEPPMPPPTT